MKTFLPIPLGLALLALTSCKSAVSVGCNKEEECATKAGEAFSRTECEQQGTIAQEKADSLKCSSEFDDAVSCEADLPCGASSSERNANCGAQIKALTKCVGTSGGSGDVSSSTGSGTGP